MTCTQPNRRDLLHLLGGAGLALAAPRAFSAQHSASAQASARADGSARLEPALARLESTTGGRLGVFLLDTGTSGWAGYRADERFPMCSTFKFLLAAAVLDHVDRTHGSMDRVVHYTRQDLLSYAPLTTPHVDAGMSLADLCAAAVTMSDNTAANVLLREIGGPAAVTALARAIQDLTTRLDRTEPTLNEATPGDPRDTTTPRAIAEDMRTLLLGKVLSAPSKSLLTGWLLGCKTGDKRIRAALPPGWRAGDKTGTGARGTANDVAILWPPGKAPTLLAVYLTEATAAENARDDAIAQAARIALS